MISLRNWSEQGLLENCCWGKINLQSFEVAHFPPNSHVLLNITSHLCIIREGWFWHSSVQNCYSSLNGFLFKIDSLRFFVSCVDNNGFVYCPEEDCTEVNVQFGIFSARRHLRQSGLFPVDKDKWRSEFPDGSFSKRITCRFIWYLFHRACRRHLALCKLIQENISSCIFWAVVTMTMPIVSMTIRRTWELRQWLFCYSG